MVRVPAKTESMGISPWERKKFTPKGAMLYYTTLMLIFQEENREG